MGIIGRFKDIMASNIHSVFNREDKHPEQTVEKYLGQLRRDLGQVKAETEACKLEYERAQRAVDENEVEAAKLERYVEKSNQAGNIADARLFERRLEKTKEEGSVLLQKLAQAKDDMEKLTAMNEKLGGDITTLESKLGEIKGTLNAASQQEQLNKMAKKAGVENSDEMFAKMNEKANYALDRANAMAELESGNSASEYRELESLTEKYDSYEDSSSDDSETGDGIIDISGSDDQ